MNTTSHKFGFKIPKIDNTHYVLGAGKVPQVILQPDANWEAFLPLPEDQNRRGIETYDCTGFGTLNAIETLIFRLYGEKVNYSDRWLGIIAGTGEGGNDPHTVAEAIRKYGLIPESMLPFSDDIQNIDEYYSFKGGDMPVCYAEGRRWLEKYTFNHEWSFDQSQPDEEKILNMKTALKYSPLGISVYAWQENEVGNYIGFGRPNHWTMAYAYPDLEKVFDSYEPYKKTINQSVMFCKRYHIEKNVKPKKKRLWITDLIISLYKFIIMK